MWNGLDSDALDLNFLGSAMTFSCVRYGFEGVVELLNLIVMKLVSKILSSSVKRF